MVSCSVLRLDMTVTKDASKVCIDRTRSSICPWAKSRLWAITSESMERALEFLNVTAWLDWYYGPKPQEGFEYQGVWYRGHVKREVLNLQPHAIQEAYRYLRYCEEKHEPIKPEYGITNVDIDTLLAAGLITRK